MFLLKNYLFDNPWWLICLIFIPFLLFWMYKNFNRQKVAIKYSTLPGLGKISFKGWLKKGFNYAKIIALGLLFIAMARPQSMLKEEKVSTEGIDIVIAMDISGSMLAQDFQPDRLGAAKKTAKSFMDDRKDDRIGLVVFAGESFTQCPVTTDHAILKVLTDKLESGMIADGTAIGMGLGTAVNRLKESTSESKVVILLTDGVNNQGLIDPLTAAETAKEFDIKVYTIGIGTTGKAPYPARDVFGRTVLQYMNVQIDEKLLREIADMTGGQYFRATNNKSLEGVYEQIDKLEKTEVEVTSIKRYAELFHPFAIIALVLLSLDLLLRFTFLRGIV